MTMSCAGWKISTAPGPVSIMSVSAAEKGPPEYQPCLGSGAPKPGGQLSGAEVFSRDGLQKLLLTGHRPLRESIRGAHHGKRLSPGAAEEDVRVRRLKTGTGFHAETRGRISEPFASIFHIAVEQGQDFPRAQYAQAVKQLDHGVRRTAREQPVEQQLREASRLNAVDDA